MLVQMRPFYTPHLERWVLMAASAACLLVLFTTLYPFAFECQNAWWFSTLISGFNLTLETSASLVAIIDVVRNIVLFIPFGAAIAALLRNRRLRLSYVLILTMAGGLGLSLLVEVLQLCLPLREGGLSDILTNGVGTLLGVSGLYIWGKHFFRWLDTWTARMWRTLSPLRLLAIAALYLALWVLLGLWLQYGTVLRNWDPGFPLILGNEESADRPWRGSLYTLQIVDRMLTETEVTQFLTNSEPFPFSANELLASYRFRNSSLLENSSGEMPELQWQGKASSPNGSQGISLSSSGWIQSAVPVKSLTSRIVATSQFSLLIRLASAGMVQTGPARILSISSDPYHRNLTLAQEATNLVIRLRTPNSGENGLNPELIAPDVFADEQVHNLIITYRPPVLSLYVDRLEHTYTYTLAPGMALLRAVVPPPARHTSLTPIAFGVSQVLFYLLVFFPLGCLFALLIARTNPPGLPRALLAAGGILGTPLLFESLMASYGGLQLSHIAIGAITMTIAMLCAKATP